MATQRNSPGVDFGQWLDITLSNRGILGRTLAEAVGVHDSAVSRWRSGTSTPDIPTLMRVAEFLCLDWQRLAVTAGAIPEWAGIESYPMPHATAKRESVRRQIGRIKGLSTEGRQALLSTYDEMEGQPMEEYES